MEAIENRKLFLRLTPKEIWMVVLLTLAIGAVGWLLPGRFDIVVSDSLDHRIFFLCEPPTMFETGDYLVFRAKEIKFLQKSLTRKDLFTKQVGCKPGDLLTVDGERRFSCNGRPLGQALEADSEGNRLPEFRFNGVIPQDSYFAIGSNPRSFDSKYLGFIKKDEILYKAYPIW